MGETEERIRMDCVGFMREDIKRYVLGMNGQELDVGEVIAQLDSLIKKYPALMDDSTTENIAALLKMNSDIQENKKIKEVLKID